MIFQPVFPNLLPSSSFFLRAVVKRWTVDRHSLRAARSASLARQVVRGLVVRLTGVPRHPLDFHCDVFLCFYYVAAAFYGVLRGSDSGRTD